MKNLTFRVSKMEMTSLLPYGRWKTEKVARHHMLSKTKT